MESALVLIIWGALVFAGPPALLVWLIRRRRRRQRAAREAAAMAATVQTPAPPPSSAAATATSAASSAATSNPDTATPDAAAEPSGGMGYSFPYGVPIVIYPLLAIALSAAQHSVIGTAVVECLLLACAVVFTRQGLSRADFEQTRAHDPTMNLATWRINWLLFFALPPALLALYGAFTLWHRP